MEFVIKTGANAPTELLMTVGDDPQRLYGVVKTTLDAGQVEAATACLRQWPHHRYDEPALLAAMACLFRELGRYDEALGWANQALASDADHGDALVESALLRWSAPRPTISRQAVVQWLAQALGQGVSVRGFVVLRLVELLLDGDDADLAAAAGWLSTETAALAEPPVALDAEAVRHYLATLQGATLAPLAPDYLRHLAQQLREAWHQGRVDAAMAIARRLERLAPSSPITLGVLGEWAAHRGDAVLAERLLGEALFHGLDGDVGRAAHQLRGHLAYRRGDWAAAVADWQTAAVNKVVDAATGALIADCCWRRGQVDKARELATAVVAQQPALTLAQVVLWRLDGQGPTPADNADAVNRYLDQYPDGPTRLYLAELAHEAGYGEAALALAQAAFAVAPDLPRVGDWLPTAAPPAAEIALVGGGVGWLTPRIDEGSAWPSAEETVLLQGLLAPPAATPAEDAAQTAAWWTAWVGKRNLDEVSAGIYRLLPLLYRRWAAAGVGEVSALPQGGRLAGLWKRTYYDNVNRWRQVLPVVDALQAAGVPVMVLKGGAYAATIYGTWGARPMADVDVLVPAAQVPTVHNQLVALGWQPRSPMAPFRVQFQYANTYQAADGSHLDLHWRLGMECCVRWHDEALTWHDARPLSLLGRSLLMPSSTVSLFHTLLHGVSWNHISPVRWVADAHLLLTAAANSAEHAIDGAAFYELARRYRCVLVMRAALDYLAATFPTLTAAAYALMPPLEGLDPAETVLWTCRLRDDLHPLLPEEVMTLANWHRRRATGPLRERIVICGGAQPEQTQADCDAIDTPWLPRYDGAVVARLAAAMGWTKDLLMVVDASSNGRLRGMQVAAGGG